MKILSLRASLSLALAVLLIAAMFHFCTMEVEESSVKDKKQYFVPFTDVLGTLPRNWQTEDPASLIYQEAGEVLEAVLEAVQQTNLTDKGTLPGGMLSGITDENSLHALFPSMTYPDCPTESFSAGFVITIRFVDAWAQLFVSYTAKTTEADHTGIMWYRIQKDGVYSPWVKIRCDTSTSTENENAKMFVKANSILVGSVWKLDEETGTVKHDHHPSAWGNSPYSVVAQALGVTKDHINRNNLHSSTGLMYDPNGKSFLEEGKTNGSFLDNIIGHFEKHIKAADISTYDYVLTHFWRPDLSFPIGNESSTAGDGSLVGGVLSLLSYMGEQNPACRLVLVSVPPVEASLKDGDDPFTRRYNGQTIAQLDRVMRAIAEKEHFFYIDFQGMELSYHWQRYTGGVYEGIKINNVHANNEETYRQMGEYLASAIMVKTICGMALADHIHRYSAVVKKEACVEPGEIIYNCECGVSFAVEIPSTGFHKLTKTEESAATCVDAGNVAYYFCNACGKKFRDEQGEEEITETIIPATGHSLRKVDETPATCKDEGVSTFICSVCGVTKTEPIAKLTVHTWDEGTETAAPTCKDEGVTTFSCAVCGESKTELIARLTVHTWDEGQETAAPTCKDEGVTTFTCSVCGATRTEPIAKLTTHTWDGGKVTKEATATAEGEKTFTCLLCGAVKTEPIPPKTPATPTEAERLPGDVDGDGELTSADARLALRASVKLETILPGSPSFLAADADRNGIIESADARLILRASVKLETL